MRKVRLTSLLRFLPALCLLGGMLLLLPAWPQLPGLLPDQALHEAAVMRFLQLLLILPLAGGVFVSLLYRRVMLWPWLWLAAIALLAQRPALDLIPQLLSLSLELCLLAAFAVGEFLYIAWRPHFAIRGKQQLALALLLLVISSQLVLVPDNPVWQQSILLPAAILVLLHCLLGQSRSPWLKKLQALHLPDPAGVRLRLTGLRLPRFPAASKRATAEQEAPARARPMLSLEEGYLVRHQAMQEAPRRRRIG